MFTVLIKSVLQVTTLIHLVRDKIPQWARLGGYPALTVEVGGLLAHPARSCRDRHYNPSPAFLTIEGVDETVRPAWRGFQTQRQKATT